MTDMERKTLEAICDAAQVDDIEEVSDGFHTFNDLYEQRMYLFAALVNAYKNLAWKSLRHENGEECFGGGWFIVGIDTPDGSYTYHYSMKYWDVFDCVELATAKHWDGHTDKDVERLLSLQSAQPEKVCIATVTISEDQAREAVEKSMKNSIIVTEPEQKKGKWYKPTGMMPPEYAGVYRCSECDGIAMRDYKTHKQMLTDFCPNCGSYNGGEDEETDIS